MAGARSTPKPKASARKSLLDAPAPTPLQAIWLAGVGLVFASVDDDELRLLAALAEESDHANNYNVYHNLLPPTVRRADGTDVPAPLYSQHIVPFDLRLRGDLRFLSIYSGVTTLDPNQVGYQGPLLLPGGPWPRRKAFRRLAVGRREDDWNDRRDLLVYGLRTQLWRNPRIADALVTFESLKRVQSELRRFLDDLIAFHSEGDNTDKNALPQRMDRWVAEVTKTASITRYGHFDPNLGVLHLEPISGDFWGGVLASIFRLLPNYGPRGVRRCPNCEWYFHPAILLKSRVEAVDFCSDWCRAKYHSDERPRKRQLP